jgi:hypothetical protein
VPIFQEKCFITNQKYEFTTPGSKTYINQNMKKNMPKHIKMYQQNIKGKDIMPKATRGKIHNTDKRMPDVSKNTMETRTQLTLCSEKRGELSA